MLLLGAATIGSLVLWLGAHGELRSLALLLAGALTTALMAVGWFAWRRVPGAARVGDDFDPLGFLAQPDGGHARFAASEPPRRGHAELRALLDSMAEGLTVRSVPDGRLLFQNQSAARILGIAPDAAGEWTALPHGWEAFDEDGRPLAPGMLPAAHTARTGEPSRDRVTRIRRADGSEFWLSSSATPLRRPGETRHHAVLTTFSDVTSLKAAQLAAGDSQRALAELVTDITARKAAEDALAARWEQLRVILDGIDQGLTLCDAAGRVIAWNRRFIDLWGLPAESIRAGMPMEEVLRLLARSGEFGAGDAERHVRDRMLAMNESPTLVYEWERPNGTVLEVRQNPTPSGGLVCVHTDITARRRAEAAVRESEHRYRLLFDANPSPVFVFDTADYRILAVNQAAIERYGYSREEFLGMTLADLRDPTEWERVLAVIRTRSRGDRVVMDVRHRKKDGTEIEVEVRSHPLQLGERTARVALVHDLTARKRAEQEIAAKNAQLEAILANMAQGVSMWDAGLGLVAWNRRYQEIFRYPAGFLRPGLEFAEAARFLAERGDYGSGEAETHVARIMALAQGGEPHVYPMALADGRVLEVRSVPLAAGGGVLRTITDFTDRHRAEQAIRRKSAELESVLDNMADGVVMLDPELRLAAWNRRYCELFGIPEQAVRAGLSYAELTRFYSGGGDTGDIDVEETARLRASIAAGGIAYSREFRCAGGRIVDMRSVPAPSGGTLRTYTDVTERKQAEEALRKRHELESLILSISARFMALNPEATDRAVEEALARVGSFVGADRCFVTEVDELDRTYTRRFEWCASGIQPAPQAHQRLPMQLAMAAWQPLLKGEPFRIARLEELPAGSDGWRELLRGAGTRSMAIVPLVLGGRTRGSFGFDVVRGERRWSEDELLLFRVVADLIASALERKRTEVALQSRIDLESLILAISTRMINLPPEALDEAIRNALREVGEFLGVDRGYLLLLDETRTVFSTPYQWNAAGVVPAPHRQQSQLVAHYAYAWERLMRGDVFYVPHVSELPRREAAYRATLAAAGTSSLLVVPLLARGEVIGAVGFDRLVEGGGWGEEVLVLMKVVADILVNAIDRERVYGQVRRLNEELEQRVRERTAQLEATNEELESFSYSVSHDLRAPLRHIEGYSRILEQEHAGGLDEQGRRFLARVRAAVERMGQLIDDLLALSRVTRAEMRIESVDLSALAAAVAQELFAAEPERAHEWTIEPGMRAHADRRLIVIVLQNLLGNAWKYTRRAPVSRVHFGQAQHDGERIFFVRDNGAGFDPVYAAKLFKPFQRLHGAEEFEGTGIGLATVQRIIARHDGAVWAEGRPDEGATFWFRLARAEHGREGRFRAPSASR